MLTEPELTRLRSVLVRPGHARGTVNRRRDYLQAISEWQRPVPAMRAGSAKPDWRACTLAPPSPRRRHCHHRALFPPPRRLSPPPLPGRPRWPARAAPPKHGHSVFRAVGLQFLARPAESGSCAVEHPRSSGPRHARRHLLTVLLSCIQAFPYILIGLPAMGFPWATIFD